MKVIDTTNTEREIDLRRLAGVTTRKSPGGADITLVWYDRNSELHLVKYMLRPGEGAKLQKAFHAWLNREAPLKRGVSV